MSFTVVWKPQAEQQLTSIWLAASDRVAVSSAANEIESTLRTHPELFGESRDERTRVGVTPPLAVHFEVSSQDCLVFVLTVHRITPLTDH